MSADAPQARPTSRTPATLAALALGAVLAVHLLTRVTALGRSLWWDEAFTAVRYVLGGPPVLLDAELYVANNHVLFSFLAWATSQVAGLSEPALRLWAVVPALLGLGLLLDHLWRRVSPWAAVAVAALLTASPLQLTLATEARGYGIVLLTSVVLLVVAARADREPQVGDDVALAAAGLAAMLTFPPTVFVYLAHAGVSFVRRSAGRVRLVVLTALAGAVTALVYAPLLSAMLGRADRVGSRFADPVRWWSPVIDPLRLTAAPGIEAAVGMRSAAAVVAVLLGLGGLVALFAGRGRPLGWHLAAAMGGAIVALGVLNFHLAERYLAFLLPHAVTAAGVGLAAALGTLRARVPTWSAVLATVVAVGLVAAALPTVWRHATVPVQAFADAADHLEAEAGDARLLTDRLHVGWAWYLVERQGRDVGVARSQEELDTLVCESNGPVVFVPDPDMGRLEPPPCVAADAEVRFRHQRDPGHLSVWIHRP